MSIAGEAVPEAVAVIQSALVFTVNGTVLPLPTVLTWTSCEVTLVVPPAWPVKFSAVGDTLSTGFVVTTRVTGIAVTLPPETITDNVVE